MENVCEYVGHSMNVFAKICNDANVNGVEIIESQRITENSVPREGLTGIFPWKQSVSI